MFIFIGPIGAIILAPILLPLLYVIYRCCFRKPSKNEDVEAPRNEQYPTVSTQHSPIYRNRPFEDGVDEINRFRQPTPNRNFQSSYLSDRGTGVHTSRFEKSTTEVYNNRLYDQRGNLRSTRKAQNSHYYTQGGSHINHAETKSDDDRGRPATRRSVQPKVLESNASYHTGRSKSTPSTGRSQNKSSRNRESSCPTQEYKQNNDRKSFPGQRRNAE
ncbi:hypothetical protein ElyMa_006399500 [Elysia marginata]|uniref:Uncharacterized protein n=1 Tax=Elysia marginata TaxID=1093978 RepID=A0AAV4HRH3_9GAST|nr:hypothetical protein ElyMa_006399500 [Elysia marginata]